MISAILFTVALVGLVYSGRFIIKTYRVDDNFMMIVLFVFCLILVSSILHGAGAKESRVEFCEFMKDNSADFEFEIVSRYGFDCDFVNEAYEDSRIVSDRD